MFIRFDMIHEHDRRTDWRTDGQTDGQTPHDGYSRAYAQHRAAKSSPLNLFGIFSLLLSLFA